MSDNPNLGFTKFVPGFDFLQNLAKGAGQGIPQMPNLSNWVAPTLNVKELDKRIEELKAVHFWLEQNSRALGATVQALEVQKMTLATLQGMNFDMGDIANALKLDAGAAAPASPQKAAPAQGGKAGPAAPLVDPLQWWGSLTTQFQQIAADAFKDAARAASPDVATSAAKDTGKAAARPRKPPARKPRAT